MATGGLTSLRSGRRLGNNLNLSLSLSLASTSPRAELFFHRLKLRYHIHVPQMPWSTQGVLSLHLRSGFRKKCYLYFDNGGNITEVNLPFRANQKS